MDLALTIAGERDYARALHWARGKQHPPSKNFQISLDFSAKV